MNDIQRFQSEHLFLLVGTNPLPNYVAGRLLLGSGGHVYLVHTDKTAEIADHLIAGLQLEAGQPTKIQVDEADANDIYGQVSRYAKGKQDIGLNYTGGTKTMAVHAYRAVEQACPGAVFSYLNAQTLSLFLKKGSLTKEFLVARECTISLSDLLALHGYRLPQVRQTPVQPEICQALARVHSDSGKFAEWRKWLEQQPLQSLPDPAQYPQLKEVTDVFNRILGGNATPERIASLINPGWTKLENCRKWFVSGWLEEYTLWACLQAKSQDPALFDDFGIDLQPQGPRRRAFQFDVAAMRGYQLFAISCIASDKKEKCKEHLFEAYIRAHQMGGDEARVGLVCCASSSNANSSPAAIQSEIEEAWDATGKVRVFGAEHLPDLPEHLKDWFNSQP